MEIIEARLKRLERSQIFYKIFSTVLIVLFVATYMSGDEIRTQKLSIVDSKNRVRASLSVDNDDKILEAFNFTIYNGSGEKRVNFLVSKDELINVSLYNPHHESGHYPVSSWEVNSGGTVYFGPIPHRSISRSFLPLQSLRRMASFLNSAS